MHLQLVLKDIKGTKEECGSRLIVRKSTCVLSLYLSFSCLYICICIYICIIYLNFHYFFFTEVQTLNMLTDFKIELE